MAVTTTSIPVTGYSNMDVSHSFGTNGNPLLVVCHSATGTNLAFDKRDEFISTCESKGWSIVIPNFVNFDHAEGVYSDRHDAEILAAIAWAKTQGTFDKVFIAGLSGGGGSSLIMIGKYSSEFDAAASIVGITDLRGFYDFHDQRIENANGSGGTDFRPKIDTAVGGTLNLGRYDLRSPIYYAANVNKPVYLQHGQSDDVVDPMGTVDYYNALCAARNEHSQAIIDLDYSHIYAQNRHSRALTPKPDLVQDTEAGVTYLTRYKAESDSAFFTLTDQSHTGQLPPMFTFFEAVRAGTIAYDANAGSGAVDPGGDITDASLSVQDETALGLLKGEAGAVGATGATGAAGADGADAPAGLLDPGTYVWYVDPTAADDTGNAESEGTARTSIHATRSLWKFQGALNIIKVLNADDAAGVIDDLTVCKNDVRLRIDSIITGGGAANRTVDINDGGGFEFHGNTQIEFRNYRPNLDDSTGGRYIDAQGGEVSIVMGSSANISMESGNTKYLCGRDDPARLNVFISGVTRTGAESYIVDGYTSGQDPNASAFISADVTSL